MDLKVVDRPRIAENAQEQFDNHQQGCDFSTQP
jgi:hypothetical protein